MAGQQHAHPEIGDDRERRGISSSTRAERETLFRLHQDVVKWGKDLEKGAKDRTGKKQLDAVTNGVGSAIARGLRSLPFVKNVHLDKDGVRYFDFARVSHDILLGRIIRSEQDLKNLVEQEGVCAVVTMNETWEIREQGWDKSMFDKHNIPWLHLPTADYTPPSLRSIVKGVAFILEASLRSETEQDRDTAEDVNTEERVRQLLQQRQKLVEKLEALEREETVRQKQDLRSRLTTTEAGTPPRQTCAAAPAAAEDQSSSPAKDRNPTPERERKAGYLPQLFNGWSHGVAEQGPEGGRHRGTIFLHCNAGKGRSFIVALCYLMLRHRLPSEVVYRHVASLRDGVNLGTHPLAGYKEKLQRFEVHMAALLARHQLPMRCGPPPASAGSHGGSKSRGGSPLAASGSSESGGRYLG